MIAVAAGDAVAEISAVLGCSKATVTWHVVRARGLPRVRTGARVKPALSYEPNEQPSGAAAMSAVAPRGVAASTARRRIASRSSKRARSA